MCHLHGLGKLLGFRLLGSSFTKDISSLTPTFAVGLRLGAAVAVAANVGVKTEMSLVKLEPSNLNPNNLPRPCKWHMAKGLQFFHKDKDRMLPEAKTAFREPHTVLNNHFSNVAPKILEEHDDELVPLMASFVLNNLEVDEYAVPQKSDEKGYQKVHVNVNDDISALQISQLHNLVKQYSAVFDDALGMAEAPESQWLRLPTRQDAKLKSPGPYNLSLKDRGATSGCSRWSRGSESCWSMPFGLTNEPAALRRDLTADLDGRLPEFRTPDMRDHHHDDALATDLLILLTPDIAKYKPGHREVPSSFLNEGNLYYQGRLYIPESQRLAIPNNATTCRAPATRERQRHVTQYIANKLQHR